MTYDSTYQLFIFKIDTSGRLSFKNGFNLENANVLPTTNVVYSTIFSEPYELDYKSFPVPAASSIYLTISGDSMQLQERNESLIAYTVVCKNLSIRYSQKDPIDIYLEGKERFFYTTPVPLNILFLERKKSTY